MAFRGLKEESLNQGKAHETAANDLGKKIADPFEDWAAGYKVSTITMPCGWLLIFGARSVWKKARPLSWTATSALMSTLKKKCDNFLVPSFY